MARNFVPDAYLQVDTAPVTAVPLSISAWFNTSVNNATQCIVCIPHKNVSDNYFDLGCTSSAEARAGARSTAGGSDIATTTNTFTTNIWQHALGIYTSATDRECILNGDTGNKGTNSGNNTPVGLDRLSIAQFGNSSPGSRFTGSIAEVGVWDVALSADDAVALSKGMSPRLIRPDALVFYLPMVRDDDIDMAGGLVLTDTGSPTVTTHPRIITPLSQMTFPLAPSIPGGRPQRPLGQPFNGPFGGPL